MDVLQTAIEYLKGVGPSRGQLLRAELGIHTYADLLQLYPNRYIDRTRYYKINVLQPSSAEVQLVGKLIHIKMVEQKRGKRLVATFVDETGQMELVWFQGHKFIKDQLQLNVPLVIFGKCSVFNGTYSMPHPEIELLKDHEQSLRSALQAVYPSTEKLTNKGISNRVMHKLLQQLFLEVDHY
jgi:ATP-dependent DNA helicase RecG